MLMTNSNFVGCSIGKSAGLAPLSSITSRASRRMAVRNHVYRGALRAAGRFVGAGVKKDSGPYRFQRTTWPIILPTTERPELIEEARWGICGRLAGLFQPNQKLLLTYVAPTFKRV